MSPYKVITVSAGLSEYRQSTTSRQLTWKDIVQQADLALYRAKQKGRNHVA